MMDQCDPFCPDHPDFVPDPVPDFVLVSVPDDDVVDDEEESAVSF